MAPTAVEALCDGGVAVSQFATSKRHMLALGVVVAREPEVVVREPEAGRGAGTRVGPRGDARSA